MNNNYKNQAGTTMLEIIIYFGLLSFIMATALVSVYQILNGTASNTSKVSVEQEAGFIIAKMEWALSGVSAINSPGANSSGATLSINKAGYGSNPIVFSSSGNNITIKEGSGSALILNSGRITVSNLNFIHNQQAGVKIVDTIKATFTINGKNYELYRFVR